VLGRSGADLLVHLQPQPIEVDFAGRSFTIGAHDAISWLKLLTPLDTYEIFPGLAGQVAVELVEDELWEGRVTEREVMEAALSVVTVAADRPWWTALGLIQVASVSWDKVHVNNAAGMSLAGWLDEVWSKLTPWIDPKKRAAFEVQLQTPPKGWEGDVNFDEEEAAFEAAMRAAM
jgi:hypothetical protein